MGLKCTGWGRKKDKSNNLLPVTYYLWRLLKYFMNIISSAGWGDAYFDKWKMLVIFFFLMLDIFLRFLSWVRIKWLSKFKTISHDCKLFLQVFKSDPFSFQIAKQILKCALLRKKSLMQYFLWLKIVASTEYKLYNMSYSFGVPW